VSGAFSGKKTKIVATIGPKSGDEETLRQMIRAGMNVARINFSHGSHEDHAARIALIRRVAEEENAVIAILSDIQGPKIRIGVVKGNGIRLETGDKITLTLDTTADGTNNIVSLPHPEFIVDVLAGMTLLLDDGNLEFKVVSNTGSALVCTAVIPGTLTSRKGVMAREAKHKMRAITDKDRRDVEFALSQGTDFIAMSFVRSADDVQEMRWLMRHLGHEDVGMIAKIEKHEALLNIDSILLGVDGIMVARGDLGVEVDAAQVPVLQKRIIATCHDFGKPVIVATQMLQSMIDAPVPTRAEVSDVANAIFDGADAVMLSGETAVGKFPVKAVEMMRRIARRTNAHLRSLPMSTTTPVNTRESRYRTAALAHGVKVVIRDLNAGLVVMWSQLGGGASYLSQVRMTVPILAFSSSPEALRRMSVMFGVTPIQMEPPKDSNDFLIKVDQLLLERGWAREDDAVVMVAGQPFGRPGVTNTLRIHHVGEL